MKYTAHEQAYDGCRYFWIMTDGGEAHCRLYHASGTDYGVLDFLSVKEEHRNRGIGLALQVERERILKEFWKINESWLWVEKRSWMQSWYERRGYVYHSENENEQGTVWMVKDLRTPPMSASYQDAGSIFDITKQFGV